MDQGDCVVAEQRVGAAGELEVVADVAAGFLGGHRRHRVAQRDPLLQGGEDGEFHGAAQGGLADEQAGERGVGVHVVVGQHPDRLELLVAQQVGLVDDQDGGAAALVAFGGEHGGGLGGQPGGSCGRAGRRRSVTIVSWRPRMPISGVGQVDDGVPGGVQAGQGGAHGDGLAGADQTGDRLQHLREVLPCAVRVTAGTHPLNGRMLDALSFVHLRGVLHLVVRLPDSSPGTIPVSATDIFGERAAEGPGDRAGRRWPAPAAGLDAGAGRPGRGGPVTARAASRPAACGGCELGRARRHLERAAAELEEACLAWGVWADGVRQLAERRLGVSAAEGFAVLDDPGYARALRMGAWFDQAPRRPGRRWRPPGRACSRVARACPPKSNRFTSSLIAPRLRER